MGALCGSGARRKDEEDDIMTYPWTLVRDVREQDKAIAKRMHRKWKRIENELRDTEYWFWYWSWWDSLSRSCWRICVAGCLIASTIISCIAGISVTPTLSYVAAGLTAVGVLKDPLEKMLIEEGTTKKRRKYKDACHIRRMYLDKMFIEYLRDSADHKITTDELESYVQLAYEMDNELMESAMKHEGLFERTFNLPTPDTLRTTGRDMSAIVLDHKSSYQEDTTQKDIEPVKQETQVDIGSSDSDD